MIADDVQLPESKEQIRVLYCKQCESVEDLPDYEGPVERDYLLEIMLEKHETLGIRHLGHLFKVPLSIWSIDSVRREVIKQIRVGSGGLSEIDDNFYNVKNQFAADAMSCYQKHLRPTGQCPDWKHDSKRLIPKTAKERKEFHLPKPAETGPKVYLCDFCPAKQYVVHKNRNSVGMYD